MLTQQEKALLNHKRMTELAEAVAIERNDSARWREDCRPDCREDLIQMRKRRSFKSSSQKTYPFVNCLQIVNNESRITSCHF